MCIDCKKTRARIIFHTGRPNQGRAQHTSSTQLVAQPLEVTKTAPVGEANKNKNKQIKPYLPRQDDLSLTASGAFKDDRRELISCRTAHL